MNFNNYKKYIVVDDDNRPMTFVDDQFCYCNTHHARQPLGVQTYTHKRATELIRKTVEFRIKRNFHVGEYSLMPVGKKLNFKSNKRSNGKRNQAVEKRKKAC